MGWPAWAWLVVVASVVLLRLPFLAVAGGDRAIQAASAVQSGLTESAAQRIARASGITTDFVAAVRGALPADGRLVLYSPYGGTEFEFLLRLQFERTKNLLYPNPRDVHFARNADELRQKVADAVPGRLLVVDGTQEPVELVIGGDYELVHAEPIGQSARLRLWRLVRVR